MRLCGKRLAFDRKLGELLCFTFSPKANLMKPSLPSNFNSSGVLPQRNLSIWVCPPMALADPCKIWEVVTPPANWRYMFTSSELIISAMRTSEVTDCAPSLIPPEPAMWECSSTIPGVNCLPVASITLAVPAGKFFPTAFIFPFSISTSVLGKIPSFSLVQTVAFLNNTVSAFGASV